ncbi:MAG TPA: DHA2 family efflux MFS transporter permease subunit [Candidatus Competibacteraceae bacterium]|nr:DHA2 family efflux MFS transporter permease subunit [Candidatus Competibacteraceae bacterium]
MSATRTDAKPASGQSEWRPSVNPWLIALAVMLATFMEVLDTSIASVALPHIAGNLGATTDEATWVLTSYLVSNAVVLPASAWFSSLFGRKRFLIGCIILFTVSSFLCGAATNLEILIVARVLQGAGGGALQPISQAILLESFPPARRGAAMAVFGIGVVVAPIIGPTLGGWLTDNYSWRWAFYINLPVGALAVFMITSMVEDPPYIRAAKPGRIDAIGFGLMTIWLATSQIILDKGQQVDWFAAEWLRWFAAISAVAMVGFIIWELRTPQPIVNLYILKNRNFAVGCAMFALFGAMLYGMVTLQPLFLQTLLGYTALNAGLSVSPRGLGSLTAMLLVGILVTRVSPRLLVVFGFLVFGFSSYLLSRLNLQIAMSNFIYPNLLSGFGLGFIFVPLTTVTMGGLRPEQLGNATGIQNLLRNIGGGIGISMVSTLLERYSQAHQALMVGHLSPYDLQYQQRLEVMQGAFASHFSTPDALEWARASTYQLLLQQAGYWSFIDLFYLIAGGCVLCAFGVLFLKTVKAGRPVAMH